MRRWLPNTSPRLPWLSRTSLGFRILIFVITGEVLFGITLGITVGLFAARTAAQQRHDSARQTSQVAAASIMPLIADQNRAAVNAQVDSIMALSESDGIECIRILDSSGQVVAASQVGPGCYDLLSAQSRANGVFGAQVVDEPVVIDGLEVGRVQMVFEAASFRDAIGFPLLAAAIVVFAVALVSAPWTAWLFVRHILEPVDELRDGAIAVAGGRHDLTLSHGRRDELGELAQAFDEMSRQLAQREESLRNSLAAEEAARVEIERNAKMKSEFVAVASHELRAPIAVVRLYAEMLERGEMGRMTKAARESVTAISGAANRLNSIVSDLMDAALLDRGLMPLVFEPLRLDDIVLHATVESNALAVPVGVRVEVVGLLPPVTVRGDTVRIRQVLDNLISNAVKYSAGAELVTVRMHVDADTAIVGVSDRGRGIDPDSRSRLFGLFSRLDSEDNRLTAGLGLGLAISARVADAHGGAVSYQDNPGGGSVFSFSLPLLGSLDNQPDHAMFSVSEEPR